MPALTTLAHSPADVLRYLMIQLGLGTLPTNVLAWPIFAINEPSDPDNCITVYNTAGNDIGGRSMIDGEFHRDRGVQIRIRSTDSPTGWVKADTIKDTLSKSVYYAAVAIGTSSYLVQALNKIGDVIDLGNNAPSTKRNVLTINAMMSLKQVS